MWSVAGMVTLGRVHQHASLATLGSANFALKGIAVALTLRRISPGFEA